MARKNYGWKTHKVTVTVRFDKPCGKKWAVTEVRNCLASDVPHFTLQSKNSDPGEFVVRNVVAGS